MLGEEDPVTVARNRKGDWIQTFTGKQFWPLDPRPEDFDVQDIAHALANLCRFGGHSLVFYSVAQHSCHVANLCPDGYELEGLMHDAAEAYLVDVPRPIKHGGGFERYLEIEQEIERALALRFSLSYPADAWPPAVKHADDIALATEKRDVMASEPAPWGPLPDPDSYCLFPHNAKQLFLATFSLFRRGGE